MKKSKGVSRTVLFIGIVGILSVFVLPRLPELMMATGITGAATGGAVQQLEIGNPDLKDIDFGTDGLTFEIAIPVENPNSFNAKVDRISYTVYIDGDRVTSGETAKAVTVPANSEREVIDRVQVDAVGALGAGAGMLGNTLSGEKTYLKVDGTLHVAIGPANFNIPFSRKEPL